MYVLRRARRFGEVRTPDVRVCHTAKSEARDHLLANEPQHRSHVSQRRRDPATSVQAMGHLILLRSQIVISKA